MEVNLFGSPTEVSGELMQELPGDGKPCFQCTEPITGKMFQAFIFLGDNTEAIGTKWRYCESCYNEME